jgi:pyruvate dehydrogenase E2 component (dihydrolipoyllysine-residue acetyltransferase)
MVQEIKMPQLALGSDEVVVRGWLVADGEEFALGQALLEIETDKATMDVEALFPGVLLEPRCQEGDTVSVGAVIAYAAEPGADLDAARAALAAAGRNIPAAIEADDAAPVRDANGAPSADGPPPEGDEARVATTRFFVVDHGEVAGLPAATARPTAPVIDIDREAAGDATEHPLSRRRLAIARRMSAATAIPAFSVHREIPVDAAFEALRVARERTPGVTFTDFLIRACGVAGREHPNANAWLVGDTVLEFAAVNVALAVDAPGGVIAPVLRDVGERDLAEIAERRADLVSRAREGRVSEHDLSGGTLTVSNVAGLGSHAITPVLTPPQAVALGLGSARATAAGRTLTATLVGDHRLLDGADGARFLATFASALDAANLPEMMS